MTQLLQLTSVTEFHTAHAHCQQPRTWPAHNSDITQPHMYMTRKHLTPHLCPTLSIVDWACHIDIGLWLHVPQRLITNDTCPDMDFPKLTSTAACLTETNPVLFNLKSGLSSVVEHLRTKYVLNEQCWLYADLEDIWWKKFGWLATCHLSGPPFFPHIGRQSHVLDDMWQKCHNICSNITQSKRRQTTIHCCVSLEETS